MKDYQTIKNFIKLRATGFTYSEITDKIDISRPTLVKWNKEYWEEIEDYRKFLFADLYSRHIVFELSTITINASKLKQFKEIERPTQFEREVADRAMERLDKRFLKRVKSLNLSFSDSNRIKEIKVNFFEEDSMKSNYE